MAGFTSNANRSTATDGNVRLFNGDMEIELHPDGKISIKGGSKEMLSIIADFMNSAITTLDNLVNDAHVVPVGGGSGTHSVETVGAWATPLTGGKALLEKAKDDLEDITI
jgi:hypothetical protein